MLACVALALSISGCRPQSTGASDEAPQPPQPVQVVAVTSQPVRQTVRYVGTVRAERQVRIAARLPGTLAELTVERGDWVEQGQLIARIDAPDLEARRSQVRAELRRVRADRDYVCERYETDKRLAEQEVLEQAKADASKMRCASAREAARATRAKLREVEATLDKAVERAPASGPVLERMSEPGEQVGPGKPLVVLGSDRREVVVPVAEADRVRGVSLHTPVLLTLPDGATVEAEVDTIAPVATGPARAAEVTIVLDTDHKQLISGSSVDVAFVLREDKAATPVPLEALRQTTNGEHIFVVRDGVARAVEVDPTITSGGLVAVEPKLEAGTQIAVTNVDTLEDGEPVYAVQAAGSDQ